MLEIFFGRKLVLAPEFVINEPLIMPEVSDLELKSVLVKPKPKDHVYIVSNPAVGFGLSVLNESLRKGKTIHWPGAGINLIPDLSEEQNGQK